MLYLVGHLMYIAHYIASVIENNPEALMSYGPILWGTYYIQPLWKRRGCVNNSCQTHLVSIGAQLSTTCKHNVVHVHDVTGQDTPH